MALEYDFFYFSLFLWVYEITVNIYSNWIYSLTAPMLPKPGVSGTLLKNTFFWHKNLFQGWNFYLCIRPLLKKTYVFERERETDI